VPSCIRSLEEMIPQFETVDSMIVLPQDTHMAAIVRCNKTASSFRGRRHALNSRWFRKSLLGTGLEP